MESGVMELIKNIVFDIGNVCVTFDTFSFYMKLFKNEERTKQLIHKVFANDIWSKYDQGLIMDYELHDYYAKAYPTDIADIDQMLHNWKELMQPIPETMAFMRTLRAAGFKIYILSNISEDSAAYVASTMSFFDYVDGAIFSYKENMIKPDPMIYERLLTRYHLVGKECIFIDDLAKNVDQAVKSGMHGVQYINASQVVCDVEQCIKEQMTC